MSSSKDDSRPALATEVSISGDKLSVDLADGRTIVVPLTWFPRLADATRNERKTWRLLARGQGIHWPEIDEDISVANLLTGQPSGESQGSLRKWLAARPKKGRGPRRSKS